MSLVPTGEGHLRAHFMALGGPCEVLIDAADSSTVEAAVIAVARETWRIEDKFSRYRPTGIVHRINCADGVEIALDRETASLIAYADSCYRMSEGSFDITSGVLRRVWRFDGSGTVPSSKAVGKVLASVGWHKARWRTPCLQLQRGMEIDLGGIGKEYAVDRASLLLERQGFRAALVNFGGDLRATGPQRNGAPWMIGIDDPQATGHHCLATRPVSSGAMATSGNARRFIQTRERRYGHILDPRTGWPVVHAPRSVSVQAQTCLEAGMLSTFGILKGAAAEQFLLDQGVPHLVVR